MPTTHTRTWQFRVNQVADTQVDTLTVNRLLLIGILDALLGRGAWVDKDNASTASTGNWIVTSSCDGAGNFGNNDNVNYLDTTVGSGVLAPTKLVWASGAGAHTWVVLRQTGISAKYEICLDLNNSSSYAMAVIVSFNAGFGASGGGADGTATARPTGSGGEQILRITSAEWGGNNGNVGSVYHCMKSADGKAFRWFANRQDATVGILMFEAPDPVVPGWTDPSYSLAYGQSATTEQLTQAMLRSTYAYGITNGGTKFTQQCTQPGGGFAYTLLTVEGVTANAVDNSSLFSSLPLYSATVNARGVNGVLVDAYWGLGQNGANGSYGGMTAPAGGPDLWARFGDLWVPWCAGNPPRTVL